MLHKIYLCRLRHAEYHQFMTGIKSLLATAELESLNIGRQYIELEDRCSQIEIAIETIRKQPINQDLAIACKEVDRLFRGMVQFLKAKRKSKITDAENLGIERIMIYVNHYKNLNRRLRTERVASYSNFVKDIKSECQPDIVLLDLQSVVDNLYAAIEKMTDLTEQRHNLYASLASVPKMKEIRKIMDRVYSSIYIRINAGLLINESLYATQKKLIEQINERILFHKSSVDRRKKRKEPLPLPKILTQIL